jgi:isoleucyl-tRNA synthetase
MPRWAANGRRACASREVTEAIEPLRRDKVVRSSLEAEVIVPDLAGLSAADFAEICIVASATPGEAVTVERTEKSKCGRCWRHLPEVVEDGDLCARCDTVVKG